MYIYTLSHVLKRKSQFFKAFWLCYMYVTKLSHLCIHIYIHIYILLYTYNHFMVNFVSSFA